MATSDDTDLSQLRPGQTRLVNGKLWGRCQECRELVRVDKFLLGSLHYCSPRSPTP